MNIPILSLCIPTYNRAEILEVSLSKLYENPMIDNRVEIIVSDNASTDNTQDVCRVFESRFSNFRYYRNDKNVRDWNFSIALSYAKGKYIRLLNDYSFIDSTGINFMLDKIEQHKDEKLLFFYNSLYGLKEGDYHFCDADEFLQLVSNRCTWITHFGTWRECFSKLDDKDRCCERHFAQIDWSLRLSSVNSGVVVCCPIVQNRPVNKAKAPYNYFEVFMDNYESIIDSYVAEGKINKETKKQDLKKILRNDIGRNLVYMYFWNHPCGHSLEGTIPILFKYFKRDPMFYGYLIYGSISGLFVKTIGEERFREIGRKVKRIVKK